MIVDARGKALNTTTKTSVHLVITHQPAGMPGVKTIPILKADVDGDLPTVRRVLNAAMVKTIQQLVELGAVSPTYPPPTAGQPT